MRQTGHGTESGLYHVGGGADVDACICIIRHTISFVPFVSSSTLPAKRFDLDARQLSPAPILTFVIRIHLDGTKPAACWSLTRPEPPRLPERRCSRHNSAGPSIWQLRPDLCITRPTAASRGSFAPCLRSTYDLSPFGPRQAHKTCLCFIFLCARSATASPVLAVALGCPFLLG